MKRISTRAYLPMVLTAIVFCMLFVAVFSLTTDVAYAADESGASEDSVVMLKMNEDVSYYNSFSEAMDKIPVIYPTIPKCTITLLKDAQFCGNNNKRVTIDLNGHTLTDNSKSTISAAEVTIVDTDGNGCLKLNGKLSITATKFNLNSGKIEGAELALQASVVNVENASIETAIGVYDSTTLNINGGRVQTVKFYSGSVNISGGEIDVLKLSSNSVTISAGKISSFVGLNGLTIDYKRFLAEKYAYKRVDGGELIKLSEMASDIPVTIVLCEHSAYTNSICDYCGHKCQHASYDSDTMQCTICSSKIVAKIVDGDTETYFSSFADAIAAAPSNDSGKTATITLLNDCEFCVFSEKSVIIDLNGKILNSSSTNSVTIESSNVTIQDSTNNGEMTINGSVSFYMCNVNILSGVFTNVSENDYIGFSISRESIANIIGGKFNARLTATFDSNVTINGQENNRVSFSALSVITASSVQISNAIIDTLMISKIMPILKENVFIKEFNFQEIEADYKGLLCEGNAYCAADGTGYIKPSDMSGKTHVYVMDCTHNGFTKNEENQYVCDYCGYVCVHEKFDTTTHACALCSYPCPHESYDENGVCKDCSYVCPHENVDDSNKCDVCKNTMNVKLTNSQGTKYFIDLANAFAACEGEDSIVILNNMELKATKVVTKNITLDLNGKKLYACSVSLKSKSVVVDSVGGGYILVAGEESLSDIELRGKEDTEFKIFKYSIKIKVYSGKILRVIDNHGALHDLLPEGYMFVENGKALLWSEVLAKSADYEGSLIVQKCPHTDLDENLVCKHCNYSMPTGEAIDRVSNEIESAKNELQTAIDQKADIETINEKVRELNEAIAKAKEFADSQDSLLKEELTSKINGAVNDALESATTALENAQSELQKQIDGKASKAEVEKSVAALNDAIANAETAKTYADQKDGELKTELERKITEAKNEVLNSAKNALDTAKRELTTKIETKADANEVNKAIEDLNAAISNAESVSNAYADEKNTTLKSELEGKIAESKTTVEAAIESLAQRVSEVEGKLDANVEKTNTLQTVLIVFVVLLALANIATVVTFCMRKKK